MDEFKIRRGGVPVGAFSAVIVTALVFVALPLLTQLSPITAKRNRAQSILISSRKPAPPPDSDRDRPKEQKLVDKQPQKQARQAQRAQPKFDVPKVNLAMSGSAIGGIKIGMVQNFNISDSLFMSAFNLNEVDQPPRTLRAFPPQYPYLAKRDNIQGKVVLRFVVDADGNAKEAEVVSSTPAGVFDDAALKAVERYKFKPAVKNGKPVNCIVKLPISFTLE
jgi:protein TonB